MKIAWHYKSMKGLVHFPNKNDELNDIMTDWADKIVKKNE